MKPTSSKRILLFGYLPPPVFGPAIAYQNLLRSSFAERQQLTFINLSVVKNIRELESFQLRKLLRLGQFVCQELFALVTRRFDYCCYPVSFNRNAFLKDLVLLRLARAFGVPIVLFAHGTGLARFREGLSPRLRRWLEDILHSAAGAIVIAESLRADFEGSLPAARIFVVTIGIERQAALPPRPPAGSTFTLVYLGALVRAKGIFDLLQALPVVVAQNPSVRLVVAGEWYLPAEAAEARALIAQHRLEPVVQFVGAVTGETKWKLLRDASALVFPCHSAKEAFGIVLLEAMQAGLPIIATRGGARSELVQDGVNGWLAAEQSPADLAEKVLRLAADPEQQHRMGEANRRLYEQRYTPEQYARRMEAVFDTLAGANANA